MSINKFLNLTGRYFLIFFLLGVIVSCSESSDIPLEEKDVRRYISFDAPSIGFDGMDPTRAQLANSFGTDGLNEFKVWGYCVPYNVRDLADGKNNLNIAGASGVWRDKLKYCDPLVFNDGMAGQTVSVNGERTDYGYLQPWLPTGGNENDSYDYRFTFIASANGTGTNGEGGFQMAKTGESDFTPILTFEMPFNGGNVNDPRDKTVVPDAIVAATFDFTRNLGKVNLSFEHLLTALRFRANNKTGKELTVTGVRIEGEFYRTATLSFTDNNITIRTTPLSNSSYKGIYTVFNGEQKVVNDGSELIGRSEANPDGEILLLLPNPSPRPDEHPLGMNKKIYVDYRVGDGPLKTSTIEIMKLNYRPQPNTRHTANLTFVDDNVVLLFQADNQTNWGNGSDNYIDIN